MSYNEAIKDKIRIENFENNIACCNKYYPKCHICGVEVMAYSYNPNHKYACFNCKDKIKEETKEQKRKLSHKTKIKKFKEATKRISLMAKDFDKYSKAIKIIESKLERYGWFDSTEEIMTAIELVKNKVKARHQVKMGKYTVDFLLPDLKVVLEIDGHIYHTKDKTPKEIIRDNTIILALGSEWEVIRISDLYINENLPQLLKAIKTIASKRRTLRKYNKGMLPKGVTDKAL